MGLLGDGDGDSGGRQGGLAMRRGVGCVVLYCDVLASLLPSLLHFDML